MQKKLSNRLAYALLGFFLFFLTFCQVDIVDKPDPPSDSDSGLSISFNGKVIPNGSGVLDLNTLPPEERLTTLTLSVTNTGKGIEFSPEDPVDPNNSARYTEEGDVKEFAINAAGITDENDMLQSGAERAILLTFKPILEQLSTSVAFKKQIKFTLKNIGGDALYSFTVICDTPVRSQIFEFTQPGMWPSITLPDFKALKAIVTLIGGGGGGGGGSGRTAQTVWISGAGGGGGGSGQLIEHSANNPFEDFFAGEYSWNIYIASGGNAGSANGSTGSAGGKGGSTRIDYLAYDKENGIVKTMSLVADGGSGGGGANTSSPGAGGNQYNKGNNGSGTTGGNGGSSPLPLLTYGQGGKGGDGSSSSTAGSSGTAGNSGYARIMWYGFLK